MSSNRTREPTWRRARVWYRDTRRRRGTGLPRFEAIVAQLRSVSMLRKLVQTVHTLRSELRVPRRARAEQLTDLRRAPGVDPGIGPAVDSAVAWLCRAQDCS